MLRPDDYFIKAFDFQHFIYLGIFLLVFVLMLFNMRRIQEKPEPILKATLILSILQQILLYGTYLWEGRTLGLDYVLAEGLPLHISRISSILGILWLIKRSPWLMDILFFFSFFAYGSFFYPSRVHPITHPIGWSFLINHVITILLPIFTILIFKWRPTIQSLKRAITAYVIYVFVALLANQLTGGNYFYLTKRIAFHSWPLWQYTAIVLVLGLLGFPLVYGISKLFRKRNI